jgi:hypothetical protein
VLFFAGLIPVAALGGMPYFPGPTASANEMVAFFSQRQGGTLLCAFLQFGAAVPLGIFTMSMVARLKFLGVRAAGAEMALFGGLATAMGLVISSCLLWAMTYPGIPRGVGIRIATVAAMRIVLLLPRAAHGQVVGQLLTV